MRYGALEAGGTKMVLAVMDDHGNMMESLSIFHSDTGSG